MENLDDIKEKFYKNELELGIFASQNEKEENVIVEVHKEYLKIITYQQNGYTRINVYYKDYTTEEYYEIYTR